MNFEEVLPALKAGKKIRRKSWPVEWHFRCSDGFFINERNDVVKLGSADIVADDWEIIDERDELEVKIDEFLDDVFIKLPPECRAENKYAWLVQLAAECIVRKERQDVMDTARATLDLLRESYWVHNVNFEKSFDSIKQNVSSQIQARRNKPCSNTDWLLRQLVYKVGSLGIETGGFAEFRGHCIDIVAHCFFIARNYSE